MADPILVNQIISSLGLTGSEAKKKRAELEKLSNEELTKLLNNQETFKKTSLGAFNSLNKDYSLGSKVVFKPEIVNDDFLGVSVKGNKPVKTKTYSMREEHELTRFCADFLADSSSSALKQVTDYNNSFGTISPHNGMNNLRELAFTENSHMKQERLTGEQKQLLDLQKTAYNRPGTFQSKFERIYKVPFVPENIEQLKIKSEEYTKITAYRDKHLQLSEGLKELKDIVREEKKSRNPSISTFGQAPASYTGVTATQKFEQIMLDFCNGDEKVFNQYIEKISKEAGGKDKLKDNYETITEKLEAQINDAYKKQLGSKSYEQHTNEYYNVCKKAIGSVDSATLAKNYIETSKTGAGYVETVVVITISTLVPGSSAVQSTAAKAMNMFGEKVGAQVFKAGMTFGMGSMPVAITAVDAATSNDGFTPEKIAEIKEKFKSGMMYGGFGAYISGPLGNVLEKTIQARPAALIQAVNKTFGEKGIQTFSTIAGRGVETTADVMFDIMTSDMSFMESLKQNGGMNYGMMFAGGRIAKVTEKLKNINIQKSVNGNYYVKDKSGKVHLETKDANMLAGYVLGKAAEADARQTKETKPQNNFFEKKPIDANEQIKHIKEADTGIPAVEKEHKVKPDESGILEKVQYTNEELNELLKEYNISKQELDELRAQGINVNNAVGIIQILKEYQPECLKESTKQEIIETLKEIAKEDVYQGITPKNYKMIKELTGMNDIDDIMMKLTDIQKYPIVSENLPLCIGISKITGTAPVEMAEGFRWRDKEEIEAITIEKINAQMKLNEITGKEFSLWAVPAIKDPLKLTPEYLEKFKTEYEKLKNNNIKYENAGNEDLSVSLSRMKSLNDNCKKYNLVFKDNDSQNVGILEKIFKSKNPQNCVDFINSLSKETKEKNSQYLHEALNEQEISNPKEYAEFINAIYERKHEPDSSDLRYPSEFLSKLRDEGVTDIKGVTKLLRTFDEIGKYPSYNNFHKSFVVKNGDYAGACEFAKKIASYSNSIDYFESYSKKNDMDFKSAIEAFNTMEEKGLSKYIENNVYAISTQKDKQNLVQKIEILDKEFGSLAEEELARSTNAIKDINPENSPTVSVETFRKNLELFKSMPEDYKKIANIHTILNWANDKGAKIELSNIINLSDIPESSRVGILAFTNEKNIKLAETLCADKIFPKERIADILQGTNEKNIKLAETLCADKDFPQTHISDILQGTNEKNIKLAETLCADKDFPKEHIARIIKETNEKNIKLAETLCADKDFPKELVYDIIQFTDEKNIKLAETLCADKNFPKEHIADIILRTNEKNIKLAETLCADKDFPKEHIARIIKETNEKNIKLAETLCADKDFPKELVDRILANTNKNNIDFVEKLCKDNDVPNDIISDIAAANFDSKIDDYEKAKSYVKEAMTKKNQLKSGIEDLTDTQLKKTFLSNTRRLITAEKMTGKPVVLSTFPNKLDGVEEFLNNVQALSNRLNQTEYEHLLQKLNPTESKQYSLLQSEITSLKKSFPEAQKQGKEAVDELKRQINTKTAELRTMQKGVDLDPKTKVDKISALSALSGNHSIEISKFIDLIKDNTPENNAAWNKAVNEKIFEKYGMEYDENLSSKLNFVNNKYLDKMLNSNSEFDDYFKELLNHIKENPDKSVKDILNDLPQNIETKKLFAEIDIDYDKWATADKNSYIPVNVALNAQEAKQFAIANVEADFADVSFEKLPEEQKQKLLTVLKNQNITLRKMEETQYDADGLTTGTKEFLRMYDGEKPVEFDKLPKLISEIKKEMNSDDFWTQTHTDQQLDEAAKTFYNHIMKLRDADVKNAQSLKDDTDVSLEIHKTDMNDISNALFLGNNASCCTAVGTGCNQFSAPTYIMNKAISAIEVMDGKNFVGNTMCYIAKVDGKPSLVLDNIELSTKYQFNDKIRDAFMNYAKQLTEEIGQPDMPIYAGPYRHKMNMNIYPQDNHSVQIVGSTGEHEVYIDYTTGHYTIDNKRTDTVNLFKIR